MPLSPAAGAMFALWLAFVFPVSAPAQSATTPDSATVAKPAPSAVAPQPISEAGVQALRQQLLTENNSDERFRLLDELARNYHRAARVSEELRVLDEIVEDRRILPGRRSIAASNLALRQALLGEYAKSQRLITRAKQLARETQDSELDALPREPSYAFLSAEAEIARRANNQHDVALVKTRERSALAWSNFNAASLSEQRRRAAANEFLDNVNLHIILLVQNNRRQEALSYVNEIGWRLSAARSLQASPFQRASLESARAVVLCSHDDYDGALEAVNASIATYRSAQAAEHDVGYGFALRLRLMISLAMGNMDDYLSDAEALERGKAANPVLAGAFGVDEIESLILAARGQWANAGTRVGEVKARTLRRQGSDSPFYKLQAALQMLYLLRDPQGSVSLSEIESFVTLLATADDNWADATYRAAYLEDGALTAAMDRLMRMDDAASFAQAQALAFRIAELLRMNASQGALADGAARLAAGNSKLRTLIEQEQLLRFEQATSRGAFANAASRLDRLAKQSEPDPLVLKREATDMAEKEKALQAAAGKLSQLRREIAAQFPIYRELISPAIPTSAKLGAALRSDEVYINLYASGKSSYAFVVNPEGKLFAQRLDVTRDQLKRMVVSLRKGFDAGAPPSKADTLGGFDLTVANDLFQTLVAPVQPQLRGAATIYLSTSGLLSSVPWNVLVTRPGLTLSEARWWVSEVTPVLMPSASALMLARSQIAKRATTPFIAFADPSFDGREHTPAEGMSVRTVRQRATRADTGDPATMDYREVVPLPETLDEARAIGASLNAPAQSVIHGTQASRSRVLKEDLADVRVVAFATHGLLPGELPGLLKAGLALAYEGRGLADSVLTIDDIIGLRLNADWVVLSACNTGYASGSAGDSMSALSRGFFASGARSLLATQWAVESESAKQLTVGLFKAYTTNPALSKADAVALVQREMLGGKYGALYRHPYFWAPYFLAGDAAR